MNPSKSLLLRMLRWMGRRWIITGAVVLFLMLLLVVFLQPLPVLRLFAHNSEVLYFATIDERAVALTIDDAPESQVTPQILDVLKANGAHATFFVIGDHTPGNLAILERIRLEGHELGNHLAHEYPSIRLDPVEFDKELAEVDAIIKPQGPAKWLRPGSGWYNQRLIEQAKKRGYRCALGSVYPFDPHVRNCWIISKYIETQVFPGAVIILHDGKPDRIRTAYVLASVLPALKAKGYRVVTLSELASLDHQTEKSEHH
jgi:peptidoglycan/xylan/chitin deacetylase (PgdA/CDA1 family)